ncbi:hypothetical protein PG984_013524 [Apiospora sp. TS-2023a]
MVTHISKLLHYAMAPSIATMPDEILALIHVSALQHNTPIKVTRCKHGLHCPVDDALCATNPDTNQRLHFSSLLHPSEDPSPFDVVTTTQLLSQVNGR